MRGLRRLLSARGAGRAWYCAAPDAVATGTDETLADKRTAAALTQMLSLVDVQVPDSVRQTVMETKSSGPQSLRERTVRAVIEKAGVEGVQFNVTHETGFELDIVAPGGIVCELDGPSHRSTGRQRIAELQRRLFLKRGMEIKRVDLIKKSLTDVCNEVADACTLDTAESKAVWDRVRKVAAEAEAVAVAKHERKPAADLWIAACHFLEGHVEPERSGAMKSPVPFGTGAALDAVLPDVTGISPSSPAALQDRWVVVWDKGTAWREAPDWAKRAGGGKESFVKHNRSGVVAGTADNYVRDARTGWWLPLKAPDGNELVVVRRM